MKWWTLTRQIITFLVGVLIIWDAITATIPAPVGQYIFGGVLMGIVPYDYFIGRKEHDAEK